MVLVDTPRLVSYADTQFGVPDGVFSEKVDGGVAGARWQTW